MLAQHQGKVTIKRANAMAETHISQRFFMVLAFLSASHVDGCSIFSGINCAIVVLGCAAAKKEKPIDWRGFGSALTDRTGKDRENLASDALNISG
jgi:hypothetical protein